jgi:hypothetical protein
MASISDPLGHVAAHLAEPDETDFHAVLVFWRAFLDGC